MRKLLVCFIVLALGLGPGCSGDGIGRYLKENSSNLDMSAVDLSLLQADLENAEIVLGGEYHAVQANYSVRFGLLTALHQQAGFKYLLCEMGHGTAGLLNIYLDTGDPAILARILDALKGSGSWSREFSTFWEWLYDYNQQLSADERIIVVGTDIEWQVGPALDYLFTLPGISQLPLLDDAYSVQSEDFPGFIDSIQLDMEVNPDLYLTALGDSLFDFDMVVNNLATLIAYYEDPDRGMHLREQAMYENFVKLYEHYPPGRYFGQFGMAHVYQEQCGDGMEGVERFAMALNREGSPVRGKVLSVAYLYVNCKMLSWQNNHQVRAVEKIFLDTEPVENRAKADYTLFRLTGEGSPYTREALMIPGPSKGATTDYFQYILAIRDSQAVTPYGAID